MTHDACRRIMNFRENDEINAMIQSDTPFDLWGKTLVLRFKIKISVLIQQKARNISLANREKPNEEEEAIEKLGQSRIAHSTKKKRRKMLWYGDDKI